VGRTLVLLGRETFTNRGKGHELGMKSWFVEGKRSKQQKGDNSWGQNTSKGDRTACKRKEGRVVKSNLYRQKNVTRL